ncbi:hypothetical protein [Paramaledivibacter caminithermalis]|jgi:hypothetical protein|uniref:Uncharacterized protein n=1 Tax=Paramaledivibacter caminithermalis (strain DSM 15212 / CIP 107654 / DViRD3) TaxID=1121301 RepID=A0A1M6M570_PARC5|nr:hypothetical protein [Paramaledivibacter caminithermalis]SHJ78587.1 hypothetical protein SAMN02745912_01057 [Paramaledivibacter caminithermalis DSM 15212]
MKKVFKNFIVVAFVAAVLQYAWEYWQCGIFYSMDANTQQSSLMLSATFGDVNMTVILYFLLSFVNKDFNWIIKRWESKEYIIMNLYALFLSFYFEVHALYTGRWGYSEAMPFFLNTNIGLIPVIQLIILFPVTFFISKIILIKFGNTSN